MKKEKTNFISNLAEVIRLKTGRIARNFKKQSQLKRLENNPFGNSPKAPRSLYVEVSEKAKQDVYNSINEWESQYKYKINKDWLDQLALQTQIVIKDSAINYQHGRVLYSTLRSYISEYSKKHNDNMKILEIGTARGFSAVCMARAIIDSSSNGTIISIDPIPHNKEIYWNCISDCKGKTTRAELLSSYMHELDNIVFVQGASPECLNNLGVNRIHYAFVDGEHNFPNIQYEFDYIKSRQKKGDMILFDDIQACEYSDVENLLRKIESEKSYQIERIWSSHARGYGIARKLT